MAYSGDPRGADLPGHDQVEIGAEGPGDLQGDGDAATREPEHHRSDCTVPLEPIGEQPTRLCPVAKGHDVPLMQG